MANILFICKHNRFRSKYAEAIFKKLNKNKEYIAKSAGIIKGKYPLDKIQLEVGKKLGIRIKGQPQGLSTKLLIWANIIIIVADDVPASIFSNMKKHGKKLIVWKIKDVSNNNEKDIEKIIKKIEVKIKSLIKSLR